MSPNKPATIDGVERDWVSLQSRRQHSFGPGVGRYIKTKMNRRFRKSARAAIAKAQP